MNEVTFSLSPQDSELSSLASQRLQKSSAPVPRSIVLSLIVFLLSFAVLFAGPALALKLIASPFIGAIPEGGVSPAWPEIRASAVVTAVTFQQGRLPEASYTGVKDVYLNKWKPATNLSNENRMMIGQSSAYRPLVKFDLAAVAAQYKIPASATIVEAKLGLYCYARNLFNPMEARVFQVYRNWVDTQATWYKATSGDNWALEGCDNTATDRAEAFSDGRVIFDRNVFHDYDVTSVVQQWVNNPASNKGLILIGPDPAVIYYYYSSEWGTANQRPRLVVTWTLEIPPTPTPTVGPSPTPTLSPTPGPSPTPTTTPAAPVVIDETSSCFTYTPGVGVWEAGTTGGYGGSYLYESGVVAGTARWAPCTANPLPVESMYEIRAHWSVHSARPVAVPYTIQYNGGTAIVYVDQTRNAAGSIVADFSPSGWYSLGVYPFLAGTFTTTGHYVELDTSSAGDTCADAVQWSQRPDVAGPPGAVTVVAEPSTLPCDGAATSFITITVKDLYGKSVANGTMVGLTTTLGTLPYTYTEAESAAVTRLGTWAEYADAGASGGKVIYSDNFGDEAVWTFEGTAVSLVYATNVGGGVADVLVDGSFVGTINFASGSLQWKMERLLVSGLSGGVHTVKVRNGGVGRIWLDAFRSGVSTVNGEAYAVLIAPTTIGTATLRAVGIGANVTGLSTAWPFGQAQVSFPGPAVVWVDDNYCGACANDGHIWNYDAFNVIQDGVNKVIGGGTVHVLAGTYAGNVTVAKPLSLLGAGADQVTVSGTDAPGSRGFYVDRADNVTISGFKIRDFETGIYLRGTGAGAGPRVENATIVQNKLESNNAGVNSYALRGSYVYTSTLGGNEVLLGYNGVWLENVYGTTVAYNNVLDNQGFGIKIATGSDNSIDNNTLSNNQNVGIEITGESVRNGIVANTLIGQRWDAINVNGSVTCSVDILANVIEGSNLAWLNAAGAAPDANHNLGAIALTGVTGASSVLDNRISGASNAGGSRPEAAGIYVQTSPLLTIEANLIQGGVANGIYIATNASPPAIHGNSIYSNGRFGLYKTGAAAVNAQGNWWGRNLPTSGAAPADLQSLANINWSPPIQLALTANPNTLPANGIATSTVTATATGAGYDILDGTIISMTSDLSTLVFPSSNVFFAGQSVFGFRAGTIAGVATVTGTAQPGIDTQTVPITLTALSPFSIEVMAVPSTIAAGGNWSIITATVRDVFNNPVPAAAVSFNSSARGWVAPVSGVTGATGEVTTTFTSFAIPGFAWVTATTGSTISASTVITITAGEPCTIALTAIPSGMSADGASLSELTAVVSDCLGLAVSDGTMVGFTSTLGTILDYRYVEAEAPEVVTSTGWSVVSGGGASGGFSIQTSSVGAAASWLFHGSAVSLIYRRSPGGGVFWARVDGGSPVIIDTDGPTTWIEQVVATNLDPVMLHQLEISRQSGTIRLDAFRSGAQTSGGRATAYLRAPVSAITQTATVLAVSHLDGLLAQHITATASVVLSATNIVWVDDDYCPACANDSHTWGFDAFSNIPDGVAAVQPGGSVVVASGFYTLPVTIDKTLNLLGADASTTFIDGADLPTPGITITAASNVVFTGFTVSQWATGMYIAGAPSSGIFVRNNVFTECATLAIWGASISGSQFTDNEIKGGGAGMRFDAVSSCTIQNNHIHDSTGYGVWIMGASSGNELTYNYIHDLGEYGIRLSGSGSNHRLSHNTIRDLGEYGIRLSTSGTGNIVSLNHLSEMAWDGIHVGPGSNNTQVLTNTVQNTNKSSAVSAQNWGGIVLGSTDNYLVRGNDVFNTGAGSGLAAGVYVGGASTGGNILANRVLNNANDGIHLDGFSTPPEIHCNHIYGNGRFGLRSEPAVLINAQGNWWGRNPSLITFGPPDPPPADISDPGFIFWSPPISLTITAAQATVNANGPPILVTAKACGYTCCVLDFMPITITTDLGRVGTPPALSVNTSTIGGQSTTLFTPGTTAGVATLTAIMPNGGVATTTVTINPGLAASITTVANPLDIVVGSGSSLITATVVDLWGNAVANGTPIQFATTLASVVPLVSNTTAGQAVSTLFAGSIPGVATVSASWGFVSGSVDVVIHAGPPFTITSLVAVPASIPCNGLATSQITATVWDEFNNSVDDGTMVGFTTTYGSMIYGYDEAEGPAVARAGTWSTGASATASGGQYAQTSSVGSIATWNFMGQAVSLRYRKAAGFGRMEVRLDGGVPVIMDTNTGGPAEWVEEVLFTNLSGAVPHVLTVTCIDPLVIRLDVFRSGAATVSGRAVGTLTAANIPVTATVWATAIGGSFPVRTVDVEFARPWEVWVDDDYCALCFNDGHQWGFDAFSNIPAGINAVADGGTVHVLDGVYGPIGLVTKTVHLDGSGSGATSLIQGTGTGAGVFLDWSADGSTFEGFAVRNFEFGMILNGQSINYLENITVTNNVFELCSTGGITGTYVHDSRFVYNTFRDGTGYGLDLQNSDDNIISNNQLHDIGGFGLRVYGVGGTSSNNTISLNTLERIGWDGIRIGQNADQTKVLSNTVYNTNQSTGGGFDLGGIALRNSDDTLVEGNTIAYVQAGGGGLVDTGGIAMDNGNTGAVILRNLIRNNVNHGIAITFNGHTAGSPPQIHSNSIYSNGKFGYYSLNVLATVNGEGNWWGRNSPTVGATPTRDIYNGAGPNIDYTPPIVLSLGRYPTAIVANGLSTSVITVTMRSSAPVYNVRDGTVVSLTASLGTLGAPSIVRVMLDGQATALLRSATIAGRSYITATTPSNGTASTWVDFVAGPAFNVVTSANYPAIWVAGGGGTPVTTTVHVTATDIFGNPCVSQPVTWGVSPGYGASVSPGAGVLDASGHATTTLSSGTVAGNVLVTANVAPISKAQPVQIMAGVPVSMVLDRSPAIIAADGVSTANITATVRDGFGNLAWDGTMVGFQTSRGTLPYQYVQAESSAVLTSTNWTYVVAGGASGGAYLYTDTPDAWARWYFTGSAVSLVYIRSTTGGDARILVDGLTITPTFSMNKSAGGLDYLRETVMATGLNPNVPHWIEVQCNTGRIYLDAFRSGTTTVNGIATTTLTSERAFVTAYITATMVESRIPHLVPPPSWSTTVQFQQSNLGITKSAWAPTVQAGGFVTYTLAYTNTGLAQGTDTLITDTLPVSLTYVSYQATPALAAPMNPAANVRVWSVGNMPAGASGRITVTMQTVCVPGLGMMTNAVDIGSLTLDSSLGNNSASSAVNLVAGPPFTILVKGNPVSIPTGETSTLRITVTDQCGNPLPSQTVNLTTSLGGFDPTATQKTASNTTNASGWATRLFYGGMISGTATINATSGAATGVGYVTVGAGPAAQTLLVANPTSIPADGLTTSTLTASVLDAGGNPVPDGFFVGFTTTMGSLLHGFVENTSPQVLQTPLGSWTTPSNANASGGNYAATSVDGAQLWWSFHGNGVSVIYAKNPGNGWLDVYVDGAPMESINTHSITSTVWRAEKVYDLGGSSSAAHTLQVARRTGTGPVWVDAFRSGVITSGGQATALLTSPVFTGTATVAAVGISETLGIPVRLPGYAFVNFQASDVIVVKSVQPVGKVAIGDRITYTLSYQNLGPSQATNAVLRDELSQDGLVDWWVSLAPTSVTPYTFWEWSLGNLAPGESGSIIFTALVDTTRFWPSLTVLTNTAMISSSTVDPSLLNNTSVVTSAVVPGSGVSLELTAVSASIPVGGSTSLLRATARDLFGNPVPNGTPITITTSLGGFPSLQSVVRNTTNGVASVNLTSGPLVGTAYVTATLDGVGATTQVLFTPLPPFTITVTATPPQILVGGSTSLVEVLVVDQYGNLVADGTLVNLSSSLGTILPLSGTTINGRVASVLTSGNIAGNAIVTASAGTASGSATVLFVPGTPQVFIEARPLVLPVGVSSRVTVTARDSLGNYVLNGTVVTFTTTLGKFNDSQTNETFATTTGGQASVTMTSLVRGQAIVQGRVQGQTASVVITFESGDPHSIVLTMDPGVIVGCGGTGVARAEVRDRYGNLVKDGTVIAFQVAPQGNAEPVDGGRTTNGVAQATISSGSVPGPANVWAWAEQWRSQTSKSTGVVFLVGPPDVINMTAEPPSLRVGGNRAAIKAQILDCGRYAVLDGTPVTFALVSGSGQLLTTAATTSRGWAESVLVSPNQTGSATVVVRANGREATVVVEYIPGPPELVLVTADPISIMANGVSTSTITAQVTDEYGNAVADRTSLVFTTNMGRFATGSSFTTSTSGGTARAVFTSASSSGFAYITCISGGKRGEAIVDMYPVPTPTPLPVMVQHLPLIIKHNR